MTLKTIAGAALWLFAASAAYAQTDTQSQTDDHDGSTSTQGVSGLGSDTGSVPPGWDGEIAKAFFLDPGAGTLRPEAHVRENWKTLSAAQQDAVRKHCEEAGQEPEGQDADAEAEVTRGSLVRLCGWVSEM